jgi:hypothetical protein
MHLNTSALAALGTAPFVVAERTNSHPLRRMIGRGRESKTTSTANHVYAKEGLGLIARGPRDTGAAGSSARQAVELIASGKY